MLVGSLSGSITHAIGNHGLYAVFGLMLIDAVLPAASELVMLYAGALASGALPHQHVLIFGARAGNGAPAYVAVALAGTLGYLVGAWLGWGIGRLGGRPLLERHGDLLHLGPARLSRAEAWFDRFGSWAVLLGRVTPLVRSFVSIPAGVFRTPLAGYSVLTLAGSAVWAFALAAVGWALGTSYKQFHHGFRYVDYAIAIGVGVVLTIIVLRRARLAQRLRPDGEGAGD